MNLVRSLFRLTWSALAVGINTAALCAVPTKTSDVSGLYLNAASIVTPRRDMPLERVSFSGLRFPSVVTSKLGPIAWVRITQRPAEIEFEFLDATGKAALTELITKSQHALDVGADRVTFRDIEKYQSPELGNVRVKRLLAMSLDENQRLIVEVELNYTRTVLFVFPVSGTDRAVYAFSRSDSANPELPAHQ